MVPRPAAAALVVAVVAGIVSMRLGGAPSSYVAVNAVALLLGLALAFVLARNAGHRFDLAALCLAPAAMALALAIGPDVEGVHRWLSAGPLRLHAAALFGPAFVVAFARADGWSSAVAAIAAAGLAAMQPDMSVALALTCGIGLALVCEFRTARLVALAAGAGALFIAARAPGQLEPVRFVENVLQDAARGGGPAMVLLPLALLAAVAAPLLRSSGRRCETAAVCGWFLGLSAASLLGPYPTPLIGYGAAPIIGYGIALGLLGRAPAAKGTQI